MKKMGRQEQCGRIVDRRNKDWIGEEGDSKRRERRTDVEEDRNRRDRRIGVEEDRK